MARGRARPERRPGRQSRDPVEAILFPEFPDRFGLDGPDEPGGSAPVREPRNPKPGPLSGGGAKPLPELFLAAALPDPRR